MNPSAATKQAPQRAPSSTPAPSRPGSRRSLVVFGVANLALLVAIPLLAFVGYAELLESTDGTVVDQPTSDDPGWTALVDPTPITAVVEVDQGVVGGIAILVDDPGSVLLVSPGLVVDGVALADRPPADAVTAVSEALRLGIADVLVMDAAAWQQTLGPATYMVDNPDPVHASSGVELFGVGPVELGAADLPAFLALPADNGPAASSLPRRHRFWSALIADPPAPRPVEDAAGGGGGGTGPAKGSLALALDGFEAGAAVHDVPVTIDDGIESLDEVATERLIREVVAYPTGPPSGSRLSVEVIDRTGNADLRAIATEVASMGIEVPAIGNAMIFVDDRTELVIPPSLDPTTGAEVDPNLTAGVVELSASLGAATVVGAESIDEVDGVRTVRLLIGDDLDFTPDS